MSKHSFTAKLRSPASAVVAFVFLVTGGAVTSQAAFSPSAAVVVEGANPGDTYTHRHRNRPIKAPCVKKRKKQDKPTRICRRGNRVVHHAGDTRRATRRQVQAMWDVPAVTSDTTMGEAFMEYRQARQAGMTGAAANPIRYRTFWQKGINLPVATVFYEEKHVGMGFFNGEDVWVKANEGPGRYSGYHRCGISSGIGYDVYSTGCHYNSKWLDTGNEYVQFWDYFTVSFGWRGLPFRFPYNMHTNLHVNGKLTFWRLSHRDGESNPGSES